MMMIKRLHIQQAVETALTRSRIGAILGPRQCGKTTMARIIAESATPVTVFDLENPLDLNKLDKPCPQGLR